MSEELWDFNLGIFIWFSRSWIDKLLDFLVDFFFVKSCCSWTRSLNETCRARFPWCGCWFAWLGLADWTCFFCWNLLDLWHQMSKIVFSIEEFLSLPFIAEHRLFFPRSEFVLRTKSLSPRSYFVGGGVSWFRLTSPDCHGLFCPVTSFLTVVHRFFGLLAVVCPAAVVLTVAVVLSADAFCENLSWRCGWQFILDVCCCPLWKREFLRCFIHASSLICVRCGCSIGRSVCRARLVVWPSFNRPCVCSVAWLSGRFPSIGVVLVYLWKIECQRGRFLSMFLRLMLHFL